VKIALIGYGKMGKEIEQIALTRHHEIILKIDVSNAASVSKNDLAKADVAIEFTTPHSSVENMCKCFDAQVPVVVGTTGWLAKFKEVEIACEKSKGGLFYASNFSIGVNLFFTLNNYLAKLMNNYGEYEASIEEIHHIHKLDSPSGTGITLADGLIKNLERKTEWVKEQAVAPHQLAIVSKRENEVPGTHSVFYRSAVDDIEIKHTAHNRKGFALGAVIAAEFMQNKRGVYTMNDLLKI
jgi:4-hydroxy-tetrahydrodipicolinate reductase